MSERGAFVIDLNRCTGCQACELACVIANRLPADRAWREVRSYNELHVPGVETFHLSLACNHCAEAPCMDQCPARAYHRDPQTGAVLIDEKKCIGCGYCVWVCPWEAPRMDDTRGVMTKCTFCYERLGEGREPACVIGCPTSALGWSVSVTEGPLPDVPGFSNADTGPAVQLVPLADSRKLPVTTEPPAVPPWQEAFRRIVPPITLSGEWPLALFTIILALLAGFFAASRLGAPALDWRLFAGVGLAGLLFSAAHLGRKSRAWRAGLHADRSWLSREVVLFGGFLATGTAALRIGDGLPWLGWIAAVLGLGAALSADMVYRVARVRGSGTLHSALILPSALLITAASGGAIRAALIISTLKMALYVARKLSRRRQGLNIRPVVTVLRVSLLAGGSLWLARKPETATLGALLILAASELVDRLEYYDELEIPTPASMMLDNLETKAVK
jgi:Fe-S-cluster-containing dehydrogenase component/DMSO reductase anchor subunit